MPRSPTVYSLPPGTTPQQPNAVIGSAMFNSAMDDIAQTFNTVQPIAYGGTGAATAPAALVALGAVSLTTENVFTKTQIWAKGADVASAAALPIIDDGNYFDVTGTTTVTSIATVGVGVWIKLHFDAALTLTHHATDLVLPGGVNILTAAGDEAEFVEYAVGDWRCTSYQRATPVSSVTLGTPQTTTSGTSIDFTGIPAWVRRITINFSSVSTSGTSPLLIQIGDAGGIETTSYSGAGGDIVGAAAANYTTGFGIGTGTTGAALHEGSVVLSLQNAASFNWCCMGTVSRSDAGQIYVTAGRKPLSDTLDRVRITTVGGVNTFDGGGINILYE